MTVSVCMITYNHENYISEAIKSILMQTTSFDFEIIIGDDCSSDNTTSIIQEFHSKYPDKIIPVIRKENIGMLPNFIDVLQKAKGKYIALLEGDDYWTDPNKLQKQVDFLEANPDYVLCSHNGTILDEIGTGQTGKKLIKTDTDYEFNTEDLLISNRASTLTVMFRGGLVTEFPDWYTKFGGGDRSLYIILSQYGKLRHLEFDGAVYRLNFGGVSVERKLKDKDKRRLAMLKELKSLNRFYDTINKYLENKYNNTIERLKTNNYYSQFLLLFSIKNYHSAKIILANNKIKWRTMKGLKNKIKYIAVKIYEVMS